MNHHLCYASVSEWGTAYQVDNAGQGRPYLLPYQVSKSGFATLVEIERRVRASFIDDNHDAHHLDMVIGAYYADDAPTRTQVEADAVRVYVALSRYITSLNDSNAPRCWPCRRPYGITNHDTRNLLPRAGWQDVCRRSRLPVA